jgi:hypothetical protein
MAVTSVSKEHLITRGQEVYQRLKDQLEANYLGKIVAIEVESGDYFVGDSVVEAARKARAKHPNKLFYFAKVGAPAVHIHR